MKEEYGTVIMVVLAVVAYLSWNANFYITGAQYYEECLLRTKKTKNFETQPADNPKQELVWAQCESIAAKGMHDYGLIMLGHTLPGAPEGFTTQVLKVKALTELVKSCPSRAYDLPLGGLHYKALDLITAAGGPSIADHFLPAPALIGRVFSERWPRCSEERRKLNLPKMTQRQLGEYGWAVPCTVCKELGLPE